VGRLGLEPRTNGLKRPSESARSDATSENTGDFDTRSDATAHDGRALTRVSDSPPDPVDAALGEAMLRASRDGQHELVLVLVTELRARREARARGTAEVIDLAAERDRRK
jgi:hypothetical protein